MTFIPIVEIEVGEARQRKAFDADEARDLESSILEHGLLHAIGLERLPGGYGLRFGERRLRAIKVLHTRNLPFFYDGTVVPPDTVPATVLTDLSPLQRLKIEFAENNDRSDLTWQERVEALNNIAEALTAANPGISQGEIWNTVSEITTMTPQYASKRLEAARLISSHMNVPAVSKARSFEEARRNALFHEEQTIAAELSRRSITAAKLSGSELVEMRRGDLFKVMPEIPSETIDLILCDPPYGYSADTTFGQKVETKHLYRDDEEYAKEIYRYLLTEGFRVTRSLAHIVLFCKPLLFPFLVEMASRMAWSPFKRPIIWQKGPGYAPWGNRGFRYNYECFFWAVKGQRGLNYLLEDILTIPSVQDKEHSAEKPIDLMTKLIEAMTEPNNVVLDPCMGSGAAVIAARRLKRRAIGIELEEEYFNLAMSRLVEERNTEEARLGLT